MRSRAIYLERAAGLSRFTFRSGVRPLPFSLGQRPPRGSLQPERHRQPESGHPLSVFVGAFIFAIAALSATTNDHVGKTGRFTLFVLTLLTVVAVVTVFVRWVDSIARLGRLSGVIAKVEAATAKAMQRRQQRPFLGGLAASGPPAGLSFHSEESGYLQWVDMAALQGIATRYKLRITLAGVPGSMVMPTRPLGYILPDSSDSGPLDPGLLRKAFVVGPVRRFDDDPRFGLVVLAEIACRALSPGINDPGTAIGILGSLHRLFATLAKPGEQLAPEYGRIELPPLCLRDMFDDFFPAIARDGAGLIEVAMRLQRVLGELGHSGDAHMRLVAREDAALALRRAGQLDGFAPDLALLRLQHANYWEQAAATRGGDFPPSVGKT